MLQALKLPYRNNSVATIAQVQKFTTYAFHKGYNAEREEQSMKLSDGRTLGFAEYGNLKGVSLVFLHGSPGSRYDGQGFDKIAKKLDIHLVCPERPGYGLSTPNPSLKLSQYPNDIIQLAKHLNLSKYHVMGISGGGPYAIACAYKVPKDQLLTTTVMFGQAHPDALTIANDGFVEYMMSCVTKYTPSITRAILNYAFVDPKRHDAAVEKVFTIFSKEEQASLRQPDMMALTKASFKAACANGPEGSVLDGQISAGPWDFELEDVENNVKLFYGHKDTRTPVAYGRHYNEHLPRSELIEFEDTNHCSTHRDEEILARIIGVWKPQSVNGADDSR